MLIVACHYIPSTNFFVPLLDTGESLSISLETFSASFVNIDLYLPVNNTIALLSVVF